jgi:hypothetical protein
VSRSVFVLILPIAGFYGTKGSGTTSTVPSARYGGSSWTSTTGDLFTFGGFGKVKKKKKKN